MNIQNRLLIAIALLALGIAGAGGAWAQIAAPKVGLDEMRRALISGGTKVIDIREPDEHAVGVAKGVSLIPLSTLSKRLGELPKPTDPVFYVVCHTQNRSSRVVEQLQQMGYKNAQYVHGGMSEWKARGLPTVIP